MPENVILNVIKAAFNNSNVQPLIDELNTISELNLGDTPLETEALDYLCLALETNKTVHTLKLNNTGFTTDGLMQLIRVLQINTHLNELDLTQNKLGGQNLQYLKNGILAIEHRDMGAFKLHAQNNGLTKVCDDEEIAFWNKILKKQSKAFKNKSLLPKQALYTPFLNSKGIGDMAELILKYSFKKNFNLGLRFKT